MLLDGALPNILCNHARFNGDVMDEIMQPQTAFITILRDPVSHFEVTFRNLGFKELLELENFPHPYLSFLENPRKYIGRAIQRKRFKVRWRSKCDTVTEPISFAVMTGYSCHKPSLNKLILKVFPSTPTLCNISTVILKPRPLPSPSGLEKRNNDLDHPTTRGLVLLLLRALSCTTLWEWLDSCDVHVLFVNSRHSERSPPNTGLWMGTCPLTLTKCWAVTYCGLKSYPGVAGIPIDFKIKPKPLSLVPTWDNDITI